MLKDLYVKKVINGQKQYVLNKTSSNLIINKNELNLHLKGQAQASDFKLVSKSHIKKWHPFSTKTQVNLFSKYMKFSQIKYLTVNGLGTLYRHVYKDKLKGYNEIYFKVKPFGKFVNNNDINTKIQIEKIGIRNHSYLSNGDLEINLHKGKLTTKKFVLNGYSANYKFDMNADLNMNVNIKPWT
jgi:hypothetical protein